MYVEVRCKKVPGFMLNELAQYLGTIQYIDTIFCGPFSGPCRLLAVVNDYKVRTLSAFICVFRFLVFVGFFYLRFPLPFAYFEFLLFCIMCWRTLTNGSHSDYQVRT